MRGRTVTPQMGPAIVALCAVAAATAGAAAQSDMRIIRAASFVGPDGELHAGGLVIVEKGRIKQVGGDAAAQAARDAPLDEYEGAVLCPGLIDCYAALGAFGQLSESSETLQPAARARDAFNRHHPQLRAALEAGVTTFALIPSDENLIGGQIAICRTADPSVLLEAGPLKVSLSPAALRTFQEPTSRSGAIGLLREELERARKSEAGARSPALRAFATGSLSGVVSTPSGADVLTALELAAEYNLRLSLLHTDDARHVADAAKGKIIAAIVGPLDLRSSRREADAPAAFEKAGVAVALAGGLPLRPGDSLRIGAAVAVRNGTSPAAARRAITTTPAMVLGVSDQVGALRGGLRGDVVVFSGDPVDLRSRVLAVYVGGRRVYAAGAKQLEEAQR